MYLAKCFGASGFETLVALKRILPTIAEQDEFIEMFIDEAKITGQLNHPNIAKTFDLGHVHESYFIAMEYISGHDLRELWQRHRETGGLPIPQACHIVQRICDALDYAHRRQDGFGNPLRIVHRDVSPQNVLVSYDGDVKVIDFGIAKAENRLSRTANGILKGKFAYMSPEQAKGESADHRSDIFAIGLIFYELLTGQRAFQAITDYELLEKVRQADVMTPREHVPGLPRQLEHIVMNALTENPAARYPSAADFADAIESFIDARGLYFERDELGAVMQETFALEWREEQQRIAQFSAFRPGKDNPPSDERLPTGTSMDENRYVDPEELEAWMAASGRGDTREPSALQKALSRSDTRPEPLRAAEPAVQRLATSGDLSVPDFDFNDESVSTTEAGKRRYDAGAGPSTAAGVEGSMELPTWEGLRLVSSDEFVVLGEVEEPSFSTTTGTKPVAPDARASAAPASSPRPERGNKDEHGSLVDLIQQVRAHNRSQDPTSAPSTKAGTAYAPVPNRIQAPPALSPPARKELTRGPPAKTHKMTEATATTRLRRDHLAAEDEKTRPVVRNLQLPPVLNESAGGSSMVPQPAPPPGKSRAAALLFAAFVAGVAVGGVVIRSAGVGFEADAPNVMFSAAQEGWSVQEQGNTLCDALPCAVYVAAGMHSFAFVEDGKVVVRQEVQVPAQGRISLSPSHHALGHLAWAKGDSKDSKPASASDLTRWALVLEPEDAKAILPNGSLVARANDIFVDYGENLVLRIERPGCRGEVLVLEGNGDSFADRHLSLDCDAFTSRLVVMPDAPSTVEIDGVLIATEARAVDLELPAGSHFITVRQAFRAETFVVDIEEGERLVFPARLSQ